MKLIVLYDQPEDQDAFLKHYNEVHLPLVEKVPGLEKVVVNSIKGNAMGGDAPYFMIVELHFPDADTFKAAMRSEENMATGKDLANFAKDKVTVLIADAG